MPTLYHYTTAGGLIGILESKSFWMSDSRFLNDSSEMNYGLSIFLEAAEALRDKIIAIDKGAFDYIDLLKNSHGNFDIRAFVASFTTEGDLLSQWRGYNEGRGYSIGIDSDHMTTNALHQGYNLVPVIYTRKRQLSSAKTHLLNLGKYIDLDKSRSEFKQQRYLDWLNDALKIALSFKNENFREEKELRIIKTGHKTPPKIKFRSGNAGVIPFVTFNFNTTATNTPSTDPRNYGLERIFVGPALHDNQIKAIDMLVGQQRMRFEIRKSAIPYVAN